MRRVIRMTFMPGSIRRSVLLNDFLRLSDTVNNPQYTFREYEKGEPEKYATKVFNWHAYRLDASFLKAYYHFELWKRYGDIAIADKLLTES